MYTLRWQLFTGTFFRGFGILNILLVLNFVIFIQPCKLQHHHAHVHSESHQNCQRNFYPVSTVDQLIATATNLSLSFLCGLREYLKYRTMTLHEVLPTVHERWSICHSHKKRPPSKRDVKGCTVDADREYEPEARQEHGTEHDSSAILGQSYSRFFNHVIYVWGYKI